MAFWKARRAFRGRRKGGGSKARTKKKKKIFIIIIVLALLPPPPNPLKATRTRPRSLEGQSRDPELSRHPGEPCFRERASPGIQNNHGIKNMHLT